MDRILRSTSAGIRLDLGKAVDSATTVPVSVRNGAGTEVKTGTAALVTGATGVYELILSPTDTATLDVYEATWTATLSGAAHTFTTRFEIVGGFFFSTAEARAAFAELTNTTKYPDAKIVDAREEAERIIEDACEVAFVPRGRRLTLDGSGTSRLLLPWDAHRVTKVLTATVGSTVQTIADLRLYAYGELLHTTGEWTTGDRNVVLHLEHGYTQPPPRIKTAALILARSRLVADTLSDRATSQITDVGTILLAVPGMRGSITGIPEVDAAIAQYRESVPALG